MCLQPAYIDACRFTEEAALAARRPAKVAKVSPPIKLPPATAAPRPAKVSPPVKFPVPVLDERLRISSSKVLNNLVCLCCMLFPLTLLRCSRRARLGVGTTPPW